MTTTPRRRALAAAAALPVLFLVVACGSSDDAASGDIEPLTGASAQRDAGGTDGSVKAGGSVDAGSAGGAFDEVQADGGGAVAATGPAAADVSAESPVSTEDRKLISNGAVQLKSDDVAKTVFDVRKVVDTYAGEVTANSTQTDKEGEALRSRLVLRIPTEDFDAAMQDLERAAGEAGLINSSGNTEDVTTTVVDNQVRINIQRRSIARITVLLDQATSIRDIVAIEAQLSRREADLEALLSKQRYLADQTAMSTIKVSVERIEDPEPEPEPKPEEDDGFFAGLSAGWEALKTFGTGTAEVAGALLPWALVGGALTAILLPVSRRLRRRPPVVEPSA